MLKFLEEHVKNIVSMSRYSHCLHNFIDNHYSLFNWKVNATNTIMQPWSKHNSLSAGSDEAYFVEYNWNILPLYIVQLSIT